MTTNGGSISILKSASWCRRAVSVLRFEYTKIYPGDVIRNVVPKMKATIRTFLDKACCALSQTNKLDAAVITDVVLAVSNTALDIETRCLADYDVRLKLHRAPFDNDFYAFLQQTAVQFLCSADEKRAKDENMELAKIKEKKRKNFLDMVGEDADGVKRANAFAENYNEMLETWVQSRVLEFTSKIRDQVLKKMPKPERAADRAYNTSFTRGNYKDVLEYCLDVNAYLKKLFTQTFDKQKQAAIDQHESVLRDDVSTVYRTLGESAEQWRKSIDRGLSKSTGTVQLHDFKAFWQ